MIFAESTNKLFAMKTHADEKKIVIKAVNDHDISLTDIVIKRRNQNPNEVIGNWLKSSNTLHFLEAWEKLNNPNFKYDHFIMFTRSPLQ